MHFDEEREFFVHFVYARFEHKIAASSNGSLKMKLKNLSMEKRTNSKGGLYFLYIQIFITFFQFSSVFFGKEPFQK